MDPKYSLIKGLHCSVLAIRDKGTNLYIAYAHTYTLNAAKSQLSNGVLVLVWCFIFNSFSNISFDIKCDIFHAVYLTKCYRLPT